MYQVISCFQPIFGFLRHVEKSGKQTLEHILRDMHYIKAMRHIEDGLVLQVPKHGPRLPYIQERFWCLLLLSWLRALIPIIQQLIYFFTAPLTWMSLDLIFTIEKVSTPSPRVILV